MSQPVARLAYAYGLPNLLRFACVAAAVSATVGCSVVKPPPASDFLKGLAHEGYTPNSGLSSLFMPGNIIQTMEMGDDGKPRKLSPPLVLAWASDCYPGLEPRESPFMVEQSTGKANRDLSLSGPDALAMIPQIKLEAGSVREHQLKLTNPRVRAFAKADVSGKMSQKCIDALAQAERAGDRPEWFTLVLEAVLVDSLRLEISWAAGATAEVRDRVTGQVADLLNAVGAQAGQATPDPFAAQAAAAPTDPFAPKGADAAVNGQATSTDPFAPKGADASATGQVAPSTQPVPATGAAAQSAPPKAKTPLRGATAKIGGASEGGTVVEIGASAVIAYRARSLQAYSVPSPAAPPPAPAAPAADPFAPAGGAPQGAYVAPSLRDTFAAPAAGSAPIGRVSILRLDGGAPRRARLDHPFRSGDRFQLEVTSSRPGFAFVLNAAAGGTPQVVWPRLGADGRAIDRNEVAPQQPTVIPPGVASFQFDDRTGDEMLYVVIRPTPEPPVLGALGPPAVLASASTEARPTYLAAVAQPAGASVQYAVRGTGGTAMRGIVFDPGEADPDPAVYFAPAGDGGTDAVLEFRLTHR